jgi:hypothetical protein
MVYATKKSRKYEYSMCYFLSGDDGRHGSGVSS